MRRHCATFPIERIQSPRCTALWAIACCLLAAFACVSASISTAHGNDESWRPILSREIYAELAKREADLVREILRDTPKDRAIYRAKFGAVLIAALTMSVKEDIAAEDLSGTREASLGLAKVLQSKDQLVAARALAARLPGVKEVTSVKSIAVDWRSLVSAPKLMRHFLPKNEGGDGLHPDLQSEARLIGAKNGILEKIRSLTTTELTLPGLKAEAKELELLASRTAVIGSLLYYLVPAKMKANKTPEDWRALAVEMRDHSMSLAAAAKKGDTKGVLKASKDLRSACSRCHNVF